MWNYNGENGTEWLDTDNAKTVLYMYLNMLTLQKTKVKYKIFLC